MTNENKATVLRQADNSVNITGVLVEKNLEVKDYTDKRDGSPYKAITGTLSVRTSEHEVHQIRYFSKQFTNAGAENRQFKSLQTIQDEYVSVADLADSNDPEAKASEISIIGNLNLNEFYGGDGQLQQRMQLNGRFANRLREQDDPTPKAEYDIEGIVSKVVEEFDQDGVPTDRVKIELLVPMYGGKVEPLNFVVRENGKDYVMDNFAGGTSVRIYGDIINFRKVTTREIEMGFGQNKIEEKVEYLQEFTVNGGTVYEEGVHDAKIFDLELLKQAGIEREKYLENLLTQSQQRNSNAQPKTGFGSGQPITKPKTSGNSALDGVDMSKLF